MSAFTDWIEGYYLANVLRHDVWSRGSMESALITRYALQEPMQRLKQKLSVDVVDIADYQLKRDTLIQLEDILEESISTVLAGIRHDIERLNQVNEK